MSTDKLIPGDTRVQYASAKIRGKTYGYTIGVPDQPAVATVFLIHGFPDIGFGWRYQVPALLDAGYRVIVPDMLGYGDTDAPQDVSQYSLKSLSADIKELASKFVGEKGQIILGGHDWGGALVWRVALWYPDLIKAVFAVCTPYSRPSADYIELEKLVADGKLPNFAYQLQLAGPEVESAIQGQEKVRQFLNAMFGGFGPQRETGFQATEGILLNNLPLLGPTRLLSDAEMDYYTQQYMKRAAPQLRGPLNWYRTRRINYEEELPLTKDHHRFEMPALFISASRDTALPPSMARGMERNFKNLTTAEVESSHWALSQAPAAVNGHILKWMTEVLKGNAKSVL